MKLKNKKYIFIVSVLFVIAFLLTDIDFDKLGSKLYTNLSFSNINASKYGDNSVGDFLLTWVEGNSGSTGFIDDENNYILKVAPGENNIYDPESASTAGVQVTYQLVFNMGGSVEAPPGTINIRIPRYMFYGRDGKPIEDQVIDIPLVKYPEAAGTGYNYQFVADEGKDYILLTNYETIPPSYAFECSITWILKTPSTVANGFVREIEGEVGVDFDLNDELDLYSKSNKLVMNYSTKVNIDQFQFSKPTHYEMDLSKNTNIYRHWQSTWTSSLKPENDDDYIYLIYNFSGRVSYATEPYTFEFIPEISLDHPEYGGEIVGYCTYESCSSKYTNPLVWDVPIPSNTAENFMPSTSSASKFYMIVKYPKSVVDDGNERNLSVKMKAKATGVDGDIDEKEIEVADTYLFTNEVIADEVDVYTEFVIPPSSISDSKTGGAKQSSSTYTFPKEPAYTRNGLINKFLGNDTGSVSTRVNNNVSSSTTCNFQLTASATGYMYTFDTTKEDRTLYENYGVEKWSLVNEDDILYMGTSSTDYERLVYGDYELKSFIVYDLDINDYVPVVNDTYDQSTNVTTHTHTWTKKYRSSISGFSSYEPMPVYVKTTGDYYLYGYIKNWTSWTAATFEDVDGNTYQMSSTKYIPLPSMTTGIRVVNKTNAHSVDLVIYLNVNIINSDHVKSVIGDNEEVLLYNYNTAYLLDNNNEVVDKNNFSSTTDYFSTEQKNNISEQDIQRYGKNVYHSGAANRYTKYVGGATNTNKWVNYESDPANRRVKANYTAYTFEYVDYDPDLFTSEEIKRSKVVNEQRIGTFYDLLPVGVSVDTSTIKVQKMNVNGSNTTSNNKISETTKNISGIGEEVNIKYSIIDNYKNSGRTLLIVKANLDEDDSNYSDYIYVPSSTSYTAKSYYIYSGFKLTFTGLYSWDSITDYGSTLHNSVAYKSGSGKLSNGYKDDASSFEAFDDKAYFVDLDSDGNSENSLNDTVYAQRTLAFSYNTASDSSFSVGIKTGDMGTYVNGDDDNKKITVNAGGYYTYRLRYASQKNSSTDSLVIYNVLEQGESKNSNGNWKGILNNIDLTNAISKGIKPVVYYSTKSSFNFYENGKSSIDSELPSDTDLSNTSIWTTVKPSNPKDITAIAIDLRKKEDNTPYVINSEESVSILVTMQAPVEDSQEIIANNMEAVNSAWWSGTTTQKNEPSHTHFSVFENTVALMREAQVSIGKEASSDDVFVGDEIIYDIAISNTSTYETISNVKILDQIPNEVELIRDKIGYYIDNEGSVSNYVLSSDSSLLTYDLVNKDLNLIISRIDAGQVFHIVVPTKVMIVNKNEDIKNKAVLKEFNNLEYTLYSNEVNNDLAVGNLKITKNVLGNVINKDEEFKFKISITPPVGTNKENETTIQTLNTAYSGISFNSGVGFINIKNGESFTIEELPSGYSYAVSEVENDNYTVEINNSNGVIRKDNVVNVDATNTAIIKVPDTLKPTDYAKIIIIACFALFVVGSIYFEVLMRGQEIKEVQKEE